jgi:hypothetical protein
MADPEGAAKGRMKNNRRLSNVSAEKPHRANGRNRIAAFSQGRVILVGGGGVALRSEMFSPAFSIITHSFILITTDRWCCTQPSINHPLTIIWHYSPRQQRIGQHDDESTAGFPPFGRLVVIAPPTSQPPGRRGNKATT